VSTLPAGTTLDHYRIEGFIGAGSMGDVYRAVDANLGRPVAIKILSERHRENDELRGRFVREARAVAATAHPNVVQVFTTGSFDDKPYLAMELLDGIDLGTSVDRGGPWPSLPTAQAMLDAARGLEAAANAGLIHRDVKPSNLVQLTDGPVKVTDFGLAKPLDPGDEPALTAMGVVVGTPDYIAPEQARGEAIDARVDIYALGGTAYFMLTGAPPFRTGDANEDKYLKVVARHLRNPPPSARAKVSTVDPELAQLAVDMMSKKPDARPTFAHIIEKLERIVARLEAAGSSAQVPYTATGAGTSGSSPTPFVGQRALSESDGRSADSDSALTMIRQRNEQAPPSGPSKSFDLQPPKTSRALVIVTVVSALIFAVGLGLLLFGPMPTKTHASPTVAIDAGVAAPSIDATPAPPTPPAGMFLVSKPDGTPWLFVSSHPVSAAELATAFPPKKKLSPRVANAPAVRVTFDRAVEFATSMGARLPTSDEWLAASQNEAFKFGGRKMWEWVGDPETRRKRTVHAGPAKKATRKPTKYKDVTFRLARDIR
jgi:serine/threonine-protein kinase